MKIRCINAGRNRITNGNVYEVIGETDKKYRIINDEGDEGEYFKYRFEEEAAADTAMILPTDPKVRKSMPITSGVLDYFPLAIAEVAKVSVIGNEQHNPGQPLHWEKGLSTDHADCIPRHLIDRGRFDTDGARHSAKLAWRALALLQTELEAEAAAK